MKLNELGFDFSNLSTCQIRKKNTILGLVMIILSMCFFPIGIIFLILFLKQVPMDINDVLRYYGEPEYMLFFYIFLGVAFGLSLIFMLIAALNLIRKPVTYMYVIKDTTNFDKVYYIFDRKKREEIYLTEKYSVSYQSLYNRTYHESNPNVINDMIEKYVFWKFLEQADNYKIKTKKKHIVVKVKTDKRTRYGSPLSRKYTLSNDINVVPVKITETVTTSGANNNIQSQNTYYFENVNRSQHFNIHPEIKKVLNDLSQTI